MLSLSLFPDIDMKKDIEKLIAEERADIILKYAQVSLPAWIGNAAPRFV